MLLASSTGTEQKAGGSRLDFELRIELAKGEEKRARPGIDPC